jgi:hypothetical protein
MLIFLMITSFKAEDQGSHTFSLAFNFQKPGTYELRATDTDDLTIFTFKNIRAIEASAVNTQNEGDAKIKNSDSYLVHTVQKCR